MKQIEKIYRNRFGSEEVIEKQRIWKIMVKHFFQRYVQKDNVVLDVAAGYCEFINNIDCKKKIAVDISGDVRKYANKDIEIHICPSTDMSKIKNSSVDVAFISNFFEHITIPEIEKTLEEIKRVLKTDGKILILQPNIKYAYREYWDYFDHVTPLTHLSLKECLEKHDFMIIESRPKFLPYTTKSRLPKWDIIIKTYLRLRLLQNIFGKQTFVYAKKIKKGAK